MRKYVVKIAPKAEDSIEEQIHWLFTTRWGDGKRLSEHWANEFDKVINSLQTHPERNGFAPENGNYGQTDEICQKRFRRWKGKPGWRVLYTIDELEGTVVLVQVRYERQDRLEE